MPERKLNLGKAHSGPAPHKSDGPLEKPLACDLDETDVRVAKGLLRYRRGGVTHSQLAARMLLFDVQMERSMKRLSKAAGIRLRMHDGIAGSDNRPVRELAGLSDEYAARLEMALADYA